MTAWQAKLPPKVKHTVPHGRVLVQNTLYAQFDYDSFGKKLSKDEIKSINQVPLKDMVFYRQEITAGIRKAMTSAEARAMCSKWLWDYHQHKG